MGKLQSLIKKKTTQVNISGKVENPSSGNYVTIIIIDPEDSTTIENSLITNEGFFSTTQLVKDDWKPGLYNVIVKYQDSTLGIISFKILKIQIPDWVKNNARWWAENRIGNAEFAQGIEFLIKQGVIVVPYDESQGGTGTIPDWIKNNAGWWAQGRIGDEEFVKGIEFLIQIGAIKI